MIICFLMNTAVADVAPIYERNDTVIEKELKILLDKEQYNSLMHQFDWDKAITQINNYYIDNGNHIKNKGITIRVRESNNKATLQIKVPVHEKGALHLKREIETYMKDVPKYIGGSFLSKLCSIPLPNVSIAGSLITECYICNWKDGIEICLDKNRYLGVEDYEIEIEYKENVDPAIFDILKENNVRFQNKVEGKCRRFFNQYEKQC